ncbi:MAG: alkylglycerol monooxygenase [Marinoscillum sp.]|jgi:alkylglycerol monooxygenase
MDINPIILSIPIYFLLIAIELGIQFFSKKEIYRLNDALTNISCGITQQLSGGLFKVITLAAYQWVFLNFAIFEIPNTWWSILLLILGVDFCYYWAHRMSHEVNLFWGGHVVHHQSEDYNFSVALRQGSFQVLWTFWFYLPLAMLGFETITFLLIAALNTVYQFWIHTETIHKLPKPIEWIFNTPSHHRVHHGRNPQYIDKNHAGSLIIWDRLFGTFEEEVEKPIYGITKTVESWNPIWVNFEHYEAMAKQLISTNGFGNKLRVLFKKPGWTPTTDSQELTSENVIRPKFNPLPARILSYYILIQFVIILTLTSIFLFLGQTFSLEIQLGLSGLIVWSVAQLGRMMEGKVHALAEYSRIILAGGFIAFVFQSPIAWLVCVIVTLASLVYAFIALRVSQQTTLVENQ